MTKEQALILMNGYVDSYKEENEIYSFLQNKGIYVDIPSTPIGLAIEKVLNMIHPNLCNYLMELDDDELDTTVEELYDELVGGNNG